MHKTSLLCPLFLHTVVALVMLRTISKMMIMFFSFVWSRDWREMNLYDKKKEAKRWKMPAPPRRRRLQAKEIFFFRAKIRSNQTK